MADPELGSVPRAPEGAQGLVDHFFRRQYGRLIASFVRRFGAHHVQLIEDGVQAALEQALGSWSLRGIPANPEAWLTRAAQHRIIDQLRSKSQQAEASQPEGADDWFTTEGETATFVDEISDDELRMLFVCADDVLNERTRLVLCLKLLCGFGTREISARLFLNEANVQKLLDRGRARLRETWCKRDDFWSSPAQELLEARLASVEQVIYLQFNEGYSSLRADEPVRPFLCLEALRLGSLLVSHPVGNVGSSWALLALMHFHTARLSTRTNSLGELLLLEAQNRSQWDKDHIRAGLECLNRSAQGDEFSRYHGEAAIQAEHCLAPSYQETRWDEIVSLYELLEKINPSPLYSLNRAIALSEWKGHDAALEVLLASVPPSWLSGHYLWQATIGEMQRRAGDFEGAKKYLTAAFEAAPTNAERKVFEKRLQQVQLRSVEKRLPVD